MQSEHDKKLLAFWDQNEQRQKSKELGVSIQELRDAAYAVGHNGKPSRSIRKIKLYIDVQKQQQQSLTGEEIDPAPNGEVL